VETKEKGGDALPTGLARAGAIMELEVALMVAL